VDAIAGTPYGVAVVGVSPTTSGPSIASLVAGVASIMISFVVGCFGLAGAQAGWGPTVAGAFAILAGVVGLAALALGRAGLRQIRRTRGWGGVTGRGIAIAGLICASVGLAFTATAIITAFALTTT